MAMIRFAPLCLLLLLPACSILPGPAENEGDFHPEALYGSWAHSYEEDGGGAAEVYRRGGTWTFPWSEFRTSYILKPLGRAEWLYVGPTDGLYLNPGTWWLDGGDVLRIRMDGRIVSYRILDVKANRLLLLPLEE